MLSGNGRHRRPRQAPALIVAAGVTGSAIAIPLLGATGASAADGTTWDRVAECESGGSWSADAGNGYFGGLQISQNDWDEYGGPQYAQTPDQASRSQQISVAEKILADQGTTPWATCALLSGLSAKSGSVDVDPGSGSSGSGSADDGGAAGDSGTDKSHSSSKPSDADESDGDAGSKDTKDSDDSSASSGSSDSSAADDADGSPSISPSSDADDKGDADESAKSDKSASPEIGDGRTDDVSPVETSGADGSDNSWQSGGSWNLVDTGSVGGGRHRGGNADESRTNGASTASSGRHAYVVRDGDSLASIADSLEVDGGWHALYLDNKGAIGADPDHIAPGQTLEVDAENGGK